MHLDFFLFDDAVNGRYAPRMRHTVDMLTTLNFFKMNKLGNCNSHPFRIENLNVREIHRNDETDQILSRRRSGCSPISLRYS
jgi:hypothetical protein